MRLNSMKKLEKKILLKWPLNKRVFADVKKKLIKQLQFILIQIILDGRRA